MRESVARSHWAARLRPLAGWLLLLVAALPAVQPLLKGALPWSADGLLHFHRLGQLDRALGAALRQGTLYPRWAPDMGLGYGFPLFNYYAPLSYYLAEPLHLLGLSTQNALLAAFVLATFAACIGAYLCARDLFGPQAGFIAALAYVYAPYNLYNVVHRGALAEAWGLAWLPFTLWALRRTILPPRWRRSGGALPPGSQRSGTVVPRGWRRSKGGHAGTNLLLTSLFYAALMLTHNILALVSTPILVLYAVFLWGFHGRGRRRALLLGGALALGLGLTAFFWVPALLEMDYVQIHQLYAPADLDYHNNFTSLAQLLAAPRAMDPALINPPIPRSIGWPQLALAVFALLSLRRTPGREARLHLALLSLGLLAFTVLMLPCSVGVWERVPLLRFVQFPWRFLGPAGLFLAILAGAGAASLPGADRVRLPATGALITIFALTWLFPHFYPPQADPTPSGLIAFEQDTGALGTTSAGDYLPVWVQRLPPADSLVPAYQEAGPEAVIPRLDPSSLPAGAEVLEADYDLTRADLVLDAPSSFTVVFNWYFFPGWWGWLDGQRLELRPVGEHGLVGADVPAGHHHLSIRFGDTPLRRWASLASIASLAALLITALFCPANLPRNRVFRKKPGFVLQPPVSSLLPAALIAVILFGFKAGYLDQHESVFRRSRFDGESVEGVQVPLRVNFDGQMSLMGYDLDASPGRGESQDTCTVKGDGLVELALYWRALQPLDGDYSIAAHLVDEEGWRHGQEDSQHPAGYPTSRWDTATYARDVHRLAVWPGTPPGAYTLLASVYDVRTGQSLDVRDASGVPIGTTYSLASVQVTRPSHPPDPDSLDIAHPIQADLGGGLRLLGLDPPPTKANAGDLLPLTLFWQATDAPADDYSVRLFLAAPDGTEVTQAPGLQPPTDRRHPAGIPTSAWLPGDVFRDGHRFLVPAATPDGTYSLRVELLDPSGLPLAPAASLIDIRIHAPERTFDLPAAQYPLSATLDGQATLLGYDLSDTRLAPGQTFTLTLHWRAEATAPTNMVVFAHLLDPAQRIQAQSDRVPVAGSRPTTGWLPGEVLRDEHTLTLVPDASPGEYVLEVGMYDPASGERLPVIDRDGTRVDDRILLPTPIQVE